MIYISSLKWKRLFYSIPKDIFSQDDTSTLSKINSFHQPQQLLSKSSSQLLEFQIVGMSILGEKGFST